MAGVENCVVKTSSDRMMMKVYGVKNIWFGIPVQKSGEGPPKVVPRKLQVTLTGVKASAFGHQTRDYLKGLSWVIIFKDMKS